MLLAAELIKIFVGTTVGDHCPHVFSPREQVPQPVHPDSPGKQDGRGGFCRKAHSKEHTVVSKKIYTQCLKAKVTKRWCLEQLNAFFCFW